jgi:hypothetical protein
MQFLLEPTCPNFGLNFLSKVLENNMINLQFGSLTEKIQILKHFNGYIEKYKTYEKMHFFEFKKKVTEIINLEDGAAAPLKSM